MLPNSCITCSRVTILLFRSEVKPVQSVSRAQDGKPRRFISALTDGGADRWTDWWRGWWSAVANEPSSQTGPALQIRRCVLVLIWTPASLCLIPCARRFTSKHTVCAFENMHAHESMCGCIFLPDCIYVYFCLNICIRASACTHISLSVWLLACLCVNVQMCWCAIWSKPRWARGEPSIPTQPWSCSRGLCRMSVNS